MAKEKNQDNIPLPKRWRLRHGAYYYRVPPGCESAWDGKKEFRLGSTYDEAHQVYTERTVSVGDVYTLAGLMELYELTELPKKSPDWRKKVIYGFRRMRIALKDLPFIKGHDCLVQPMHIFQYHAAVKEMHGVSVARHDVRILSSLLTFAVMRGIITRNPLKGQIAVEGPKPRDRVITDSEVINFLSYLETKIAERKKNYSVMRLHCYIRLKIMIGARRRDILRLTSKDIQDDGIHIYPTKTRATSGKRVIITWDEDKNGVSILRNLIEQIQAIPPDIAWNSYLFVTREGKPYIKDDDTDSAFSSLWKRYMNMAVETGELSERFIEKDLRAKNATDSDTLEEAAKRLAHASTNTTSKVYRRKAERVPPLRKDYKNYADNL